MSTAHILKNKNDKLIDNKNDEELVMSPPHDDDKVSKEYCTLQHNITNEKLDELITITKKLNKLIVGNGEKGMLERQNNLEEKVNNHIEEQKLKSKEEKESEEKVKKTIFELLKTFTPYFLIAGGGGTMVKVLDILQSYFSS